MKKVFALVLFLFLSISLFADVAVKYDLKETKESWRGIWTVEVYSIDGGRSLISGKNKLFGIMMKDRLVLPGVREDIISHLRVIDLNGVEYTVVAFSTTNEFAWIVEDISITSVKVIVKSNVTGQEVSRFLIKIQSDDKDNNEQEKEDTDIEE